MDGSDKIILVAQDLFFLPRAYNAAAPQGYEVAQAQTADRFHDTWEDAAGSLPITDIVRDAIRRQLDRVPAIAGVRRKRRRKGGRRTG